MDVIEVPTNASAPMYVTVSGIVYAVMLEQPLNMLVEIVVGLVSVTEVKFVQFSKIPEPNVAPSPKIVALCRFTQSLNTEFLNCVNCAIYFCKIIDKKGKIVYNIIDT